MKLKHAYPADEVSWQPPPPTEIDQQVIDRHHKVAEIVNRHLWETRDEILRSIPEG
jgi:hypothetical protein